MTCVQAVALGPPWQPPKFSQSKHPGFPFTILCAFRFAVFSLLWHMSQDEGVGFTVAAGVAVGTVGGVGEGFVTGVGVGAEGFTIHTEGGEGVGFVTGVGV